MFIKDMDCTKDMPVILGQADRPIYGNFVGDAESCVYWEDKAAVRSIQTGAFSVGQVYVKDWKYPAGAFHGAEGGPG